ncbi:MAG: class II aldolase/adducin family protein [Bacillota bacterium]|nr:class II aldolase/adducin family protein [Bacillota bacterium]
MTDTDFSGRHQAALAAFSRLSQTAGARQDYVQGGGGNTSVKLDGQLMAIKASGFRLGQITPERAYAVVDYRALQDFYRDTDPARLDDVEAAGSAAARAATRVIPGLEPLRPSVETGFHAILERFVLHSHAVWANLICTAGNGPELAAAVMEDVGESFAFVPYINPGTALTFAIAGARAAAGNPRVIFLQNHGLIVTADTADAALSLHDRVNEAAAARFGLSMSDWPPIRIAGDGRDWHSATPWLTGRLRDGDWEPAWFLDEALYPDQLVFLRGHVATGTDRALFDRDPELQALIDPGTGAVCYRATEAQARTIEETLVAVLFIRDQLARHGLEIVPMDRAGQSFIAGWEVESYRRSVGSREA